MADEFESKWGEVKSSPTFQKLSPREQQDLARFYARKMGREKHGIKGSDPRMKTFLAENLGQAPTRPSTKSAFGEGLREGFDQSAVGMTANRRLPEPGMGIIDAVKEISADRLFGEGALRGIAGATGAMVGQTPDLLLGAGAGSLAAKGLAKAGVKALPAAVAASVSTGAAIPGAAVKIAGGTNEQATQAAALGAAGGLLPFAGKIPAGKLNPNLTRPAPPPKPVIAARPGPGKVPLVNMAKNQEPKVYQARDPEFLQPEQMRALLNAERTPITNPGRLLPPAPQGPQPYPDWMAGGPGGVIERPSRLTPDSGVIDAPPVGYFDAMGGKAGERPASVVDALDPEAPWIPYRGNLLPPAGGTSLPGRGPIAAPPIGGEPGAMPGVFDAGTLEARNWGRDFALYDQMGNRPGTWRKKVKEPDYQGDDPLAPMDWSGDDDAALLSSLTQYKRKLASAKQNTTRLTNKIRAEKGARGGHSRADESMLQLADEDMRGYQVQVDAIGAEISRRGLSAGKKPKGKQAPPPTDAPAPVQGGGAADATLVTGAFDDAPPSWYDPSQPPAGNMSGEQHAEWRIRRERGDLVTDTPIKHGPPSTLPGSRPSQTYLVRGRKVYVDVLDQGGRTRPDAELALEAEMRARSNELAEEFQAMVKQGDRHLTLRPSQRLKAENQYINERIREEFKDRAPIGVDPSPPAGPVRGDALRRLAAEEDGTFDPAAAYQAAGQAVEGARQLWRGGKDIAARATRAAAPIVQRLSPVERAVMGSGAQALGERTGINAATRGLGAAIDRELHSPTTVGPEGLRAVADAAKRYGTSGYNVPDDVFQQYTRIAPARAREQFKPTGELAVDLAKRLTSGEQFDLHKQAAEPTYQGTLSPDAQRVRADNQRVSDYLLSLGVITPEEHAKWGDTYLPREYAMHEATDKGAAAAFRVKRGVNKIKGSYGRGTEEVVNGQKQWRDYTPEERAKWGERRNVSRGLALKKARGEQQAAAAEFLRWVGQQPDYTIDPKVTSPGVPYAKLPETIQGPNGQTFRLLSDKDATPGGARRRVKRYGDLSGKYVREDVHGFIWDQVLLDDLVRAGNVLSQNPLWKRMKTIWNAPNYFINNAFHNTPMLLANGGALSDVPAAAVKVLDHDPLVARLEADGFIKNDAMAHELAGHVVRILREQNQSTMPGAFTMSKILSDAADNLRALEGEGYNIAQSTDDFFRVALVDRLMQDGVPYEEAAKRMQGTYYNPDQVTAPAARLLGATAVPFAKVNWYVADALKNTVANNPLRTAQIVALYYAAPYVMGALQGKGPAAIDQERETLPPHMQGTGNALPIQVPGAGVPTWVNFAAGNPLNNWMANDEAPLPIIKGFTPGGFLPSLLPLTQRNGADPFTGKPIVERDQEKNIVKDNRMDYLMRNFAPGAISTAWRTSEAMQGHVTPRGDIIPRPVAAARALGIQAQPVDLAHAADMATVAGKNDARKYRAEAYRLLRYAEAARENEEEGAAERAEAEADRFLDQAAQAEEAAGRKAERLTPKEVAP